MRHFGPMPQMHHDRAPRGERRRRAEAEAAAFDLDMLVGEHARLLFLLDRTATLRHVADLVRRATGSDLSAVASREDDGLIVIRFISGAHGHSPDNLTIARGPGLGGSA